MKVRDCFEINPSKNTNKYTDFINYIDTSSVNAGVLEGITYLEKDYPSRAQRLVKKGDILYSSVRPNLKHYYLYNDDYEHTVASTGFVLLRNKDEQKYSTEFAKYFLGTGEIVGYLSGIAELSQATFPSFSPKDIAKIDLPDLTVEQQKEIVEKLSTYDSLIELNNKRIKLLEQMAENLYKEWFVRFRFPGHEKAEFENGIPKGWEIKRLDEIADIIMGQSPESEYYNEDGLGLPFHQGVGSYGEYYLKDDIYSTVGKRIAEANSIIFSVRAPVGRINITLNKIILGRGVAAINSKFYQNGLLYWMLKKKFTAEDSIGNGSIFASVTKEELFRQKFVIPEKSLCGLFDKFAKDIEKQMRTLYLSNENLIKQRDLLLPRLMSGKLEV